MKEKYTLFGIKILQSDDYKKDKEFSKYFLKLSLPKYIHEADLYDPFNYIGINCYLFVKNRKKINSLHNINDFTQYVNSKLEKFIRENNKEAASELIEYYNLALEIFRIINKYYNEDGTKK